MLKQFIIASSVLFYSMLPVHAFAEQVDKKTENKPIVITSETLTADNKNNTAVFEGSVVAKTDDITMYSDAMTVFYDNVKSKINRIHAVGNVKVINNARALFSDEAIYFDSEGKIIFSGNPKVVEGDNVITGRQITFFLKDERAEIEGSRVILQNTQELN